MDVQGSAVTSPTVVYAVNAAYVRPALVSIYSLQKHASRLVDVTLYLNGDIGPREWGLIDHATNRLGLRLKAEVFDDSCFSGFEELNSKFPTITLFPLALPGLVEGRCLFLDADTLVMGDVWELLGADMEGLPIGACSSIGRGDLFSVPLPPRSSKREETITRLKALGFMPSEGNYFNSGVLLMDCHVIRDQYPYRTLTKVEEIRPFPKLPDQDRLNQIFHGHWFQLPLQWNTRVSIKRYIAKNEYRYRYAPEDLKRQMREAAERPMVWHYMGDKKPWTGNGKWPFWRWARWTRRAFRDYDSVLAEFNEILAT